MKTPIKPTLLSFLFLCFSIGLVFSSTDVGIERVINDAWDDDNNMLRTSTIDDVGASVTIEFPHHEIHEGDSYMVESYDSVMADKEVTCLKK